MIQSIPATENPSETCSTDVSTFPIDPPQSKYIKNIPNHNRIPFDAAFIQSKMWGSSYPEVPATTIHCRCSMSWQRVGNVFWGLANTLNGKSVDARGAGTKSETHRPVDVGGQKSNNRPQIDRDIRKTMVFMKILDIITEMESSKTCMLSILGDGGVTVIHPNHPNYPTVQFGEQSLRRSINVVQETMDVPVLVGFTVVQQISRIVMEIFSWRLGRASVSPCKKKEIDALTSTLRIDDENKKVESLDSSLRSKRLMSKTTTTVRQCAWWATWLLKTALFLSVLSVVVCLLRQLFRWVNPHVDLKNYKKQH